MSLPSSASLPPHLPFSPYKSSQSTRPSSLCCRGTSHQLSILCIVKYTFQCYSLICPTLSFPHSVHSLHLCLYFCPENRYISTMCLKFYTCAFSSVQSLSCVQLLVTPWTAAHQASLSITNSWSLLKGMTIESVMPSNHLILCHPLLLLPSIFPSIRVFS